MLCWLFLARQWGAAECFLNQSMDRINVLEKSLISTGGRGLKVGRDLLGERGMYDIKQSWQGRGETQEAEPTGGGLETKVGKER